MKLFTFVFLLMSLFLMNTAGAGDQANQQTTQPQQPVQNAVQKKATAGKRPEIEQGKKAHSSFAISNRCPEPHRVRVTTKVKFLRFERPVDAILMGPAETQQIGVEFDTTTLKIGVHPGKLVVKCLDCEKQARKCMQSPMELPFEIAVTPNRGEDEASKTQPPVESHLPNIYSWCVEYKVSTINQRPTCKRYVSPNFSKGPCPKNAVQLPSDGTVVPDYGTVVPIGSCFANVKKAPPPGGIHIP